MQIGNFGGHSNLHQVTECMHDHEQIKKKGAGGAAAQAAQQPSGSVESVGAANINTWLTNILNRSRNVLGRIWGGSGISSGSAVSGSAAEMTNAVFRQGSASASQNVYTAHTAQSVVPAHPNMDAAVQKAGNPWFVPVEHQGTVRTAHPGGIRERVKARFSSVSNFLTKHLPAGSGTFSFSGMKKHKKEENLTRKSHYRDDASEIECILTDDSYLLDSYDKNGAYKQIGR